MSNHVPAEVFPPGEILSIELEARGWTQTEFAEIIRRPARLVNEIIAGKRAITPETAREFGAALGTSAQFWLNMESSYQLGRMAPSATVDIIAREAKLREQFPVREIIKRGWIEPSQNYEVVEARVLSYFGIKSIDEKPQLCHAARRDYKEELSNLQFAWLFRVKQLASALQIPKYDENKLRESLSELELLMTEPEGVRHVPKILAEAGVRFVIVEPIPGSKINGVCLWIDNKKSPIIGMTLKGEFIDLFWFDLRHEIEHVLRGDGKDGAVIDTFEQPEQGANEDDCEKIANKAAADFCVPQKDMDGFIARLDPMYSDENLIGFARLIKRHPGIVAGQLQRRTYRWTLFKKFQSQSKVRNIIIKTALTDGYGCTAPINI